MSFQSAPGVRLSGSLTLPAGAGPFPAAVLITGSGPQDRDETLLGHKPFLVLADHLTRNGVAVLRYDDRGFGRSTGVFTSATSEDFATDAAAAVAFLRQQPAVDPARIGLIGHSEGGLVAPMVAGKDPQVAYVVLLAGPAVPSREVMAAQRKALLQAAQAPPERIEQALARWSRIDQAVAASGTDPAAREAVSQAAAAELTQMGLPAPMAALNARTLSTPWYRWFITYDPQPALAALRLPVLALNGEKDLQVLAAQNAPAMRQALAANPRATVVELAGLNHLFQTARTGAPGEYAQIEETFAPSALKTISDWILAATR